LVAAMENSVTSQHTTQFAMAATNHNTLGSDEMRSDETSDENASLVLTTIGLSRV